jgi:hypothetical protein
MKLPVLNFCLPLVFCLALSCGKKAEIQSTSPNGAANIQLLAEKPTFADPFKVNILIKSDSLSEKAGIEIFAGDLTDENVTFRWTDDQHCTLEIEQQDGIKRSFAIVVSNNNIGLRETSKE